MLFDHDLASRQETITNRLGYKTVMLYDDYGNVVQTQRELKENGATTWLVSGGAYEDSRHPDLPTSTSVSVSVTGNGAVRLKTTRLSYNNLGDVETMTDPNGNVTQTLYNDRATSSGSRTRGAEW